MVKTAIPCPKSLGNIRLLGTQTSTEYANHEQWGSCPRFSFGRSDQWIKGSFTGSWIASRNKSQGTNNSSKNKNNFALKTPVSEFPLGIFKVDHDVRGFYKLDNRLQEPTWSSPEIKIICFYVCFLLLKTQYPRTKFSWLIFIHFLIEVVERIS